MVQAVGAKGPAAMSDTYTPLPANVIYYLCCDPSHKSLSEVGPWEIIRRDSSALLPCRDARVPETEGISRRPPTRMLNEQT